MDRYMNGQNWTAERRDQKWGRDDLSRINRLNLLTHLDLQGELGTFAEHFIPGGH